MIFGFDQMSKFESWNPFLRRLFNDRCIVAATNKASRCSLKNTRLVVIATTLLHFTRTRGVTFNGVTSIVLHLTLKQGEPCFLFAFDSVTFVSTNRTLHLK